LGGEGAAITESGSGAGLTTPADDRRRSTRADRIRIATFSVHMAKADAAPAHTTAIEVRMLGNRV
jgi:hypothetical protein